MPEEEDINILSLVIINNRSEDRLPFAQIKMALSSLNVEVEVCLKDVDVSFVDKMKMASSIMHSYSFIIIHNFNIKNQQLLTYQRVTNRKD